MSDTNSEDRREDLIQEVQRLDNKLDRLVMADDIHELSEYSRPDYYEQFGSWDEALAAAGIDKESYLLRELARVWSDLGRPPSFSEMNENSIYSGGLYQSYFGSWTAAKETLRSKSNQFSIPIEGSSMDNDESELVEWISSNSSLITDIPRNARLDNPILLYVVSVTIDPGDKRTARLQVRDIADNECPMEIWVKHNINCAWKANQWFLFHHVRGNRWEKNNETSYNLSSTRDLAIIEIGKSLDRESIQEFLTSPSQKQGSQAVDRGSDILNQLEKDIEG